MIIRPGTSSQVLITQPDHATLAAEIMRRWRADGLTESPRRSAILLAIEEHDNGWAEVDAAPIVDVATGRILDFVNVPDDVRREVWPRGITRLGATPYAAALVSQHALHIYRRYRTNPEWTAFFATMETARDRYLRETPSATLDELLRDYRFVRVGDLASLTFCNGWAELPTDECGYAMRLDDERLVISPDPFAGASVPIVIAARELPNRAFASTSDAREAFAIAGKMELKGIACGA